jgi:hypothetical protein
VTIGVPAHLARARIARTGLATSSRVVVVPGASRRGAIVISPPGAGATPTRVVRATPARAVARLATSDRADPGAVRTRGAAAPVPNADPVASTDPAVVADVSSRRATVIALRGPVGVRVGRSSPEATVRAARVRARPRGTDPVLAMPRDRPTRADVVPGPSGPVVARRTGVRVLPARAAIVRTFGGRRGARPPRTGRRVGTATMTAAGATTVVAPRRMATDRAVPATIAAGTRVRVPRASAVIGGLGLRVVRRSVIGGLGLSAVRSVSGVRRVSVVRRSVGVMRGGAAGTSGVAGPGRRAGTPADRLRGRTDRARRRSGSGPSASRRRSCRRTSRSGSSTARSAGGFAR